MIEGIICLLSGITTFLFVTFSRIWHKERKILREANEKLRKSNRELEAQVEFLKDEVEKYRKGDCVEGEYCEACKHANVVRTQEHGYGGTYTTCRTSCLLNVPCAKFEREE